MLRMWLVPLRYQWSNDEAVLRKNTSLYAIISFFFSLGHKMLMSRAGNATSEPAPYRPKKRTAFSTRAKNK